MASQQGKITILHSIFMTSKAERHYKTSWSDSSTKAGMFYCSTAQIHSSSICESPIQTHCDGANLKAVARSNVSCKLTGWTQAT